ncbi:MAG TPA: hypothetical protein VMI33_01280 [Streptosporangiaceae bacterium]|nr:hypothetical protein [Streptosporangiaceae bacterium]
MSNRAPGARRPRVYVHIGEPKTGTTFLQSAMWSNRARLAAQGILLPGYRRQDHNRASRDLREAPRADSDPAERWIGEWDVLVGQALRAPGAAVISDEVLVACNPAQAERAVRSLHAAEVHIILVVRDFATLLPAEWQETVKCRGTAGWDEWLGSVIEHSADASRRWTRFWMLHDTMAILDMWSRHLPPDQVHVITMPRQGPAGELWARFASVLGIDPGRIDLSRAHANSSLGLPEAEFLRRMNLALPEDLPDWFYTRTIKRVLAHDVLDARSRQARLVVPADRAAWAREQADILVGGLRDSKFHIVGDLAELVPPPGAGPQTPPSADPALLSAAGPALLSAADPALVSAAGPGLLSAADPALLSAAGPGLPPGDPPAEQLLDAAVAAAAALAERLYRVTCAARPERDRPGGPRQMASQFKWRMLNGPWIKRVLRNSSHVPAVRRLRVVFWRILMRPARHAR